MKPVLPILLLCAVLTGAGCAKVSDAPVSPTSEDKTDVSNATPKKWDRTVSFNGVAFEAPAGHWVYADETTQTHYVIPGTPPAEGGKDPGPTSIPQSVVVFNPLQNDPNSFPTWERFELTMAQFSCASGSNVEDFLTCTDKPTKVQTGKTAGGLLYRQFTLPVVLQKDKSPRGSKTFIVVRLGANSQEGLLVSMLMDDDRSTIPALELVKSMRFMEASTILKAADPSTSTSP